MSIHELDTLDISLRVLTTPVSNLGQILMMTCLLDSPANLSPRTTWGVGTLGLTTLGIAVEHVGQTLTTDSRG